MKLPQTMLRSISVKHVRWPRILTGSKLWYSTQMAMTPEEKMITDKLQQELEPEVCKVQDVSGGCGSMFAINITSKKFDGLSLIKQHQLVNRILRDDISRWHGLQLTTKKSTGKGPASS
ncbi:XXYS1_4_G0050890.mRNA.1.CDS.1 [Saccharomyces cerevisiae]|nr:XXYS1_4_G0050890.mRNA.1.CDS.1 [Saccharomyces cerevisiae]CAD6594805.1 EM14S01-3B_G0048190.mRNA.1.CDS.1 [Saccharomyces cerevisiae]CAI4234650.1 AMH_1a_G0000180.mRNA.1.CDS.1 [Saccharomyces cerevisiae]CAI4235473.1 CEI_1a_G0000080.mRNA.1.CDS.1 [Saccharomyces cerevisiae]CAI6467002.1 AMH_1a_G0000180.mRNA.1.CDS.1 [Saccharomyces cerevisiae]